MPVTITPVNWWMNQGLAHRQCTILEFQTWRDIRAFTLTATVKTEMRRIDIGRHIRVCFYGIYKDFMIEAYRDGGSGHGYYNTGTFFIHMPFSLVGEGSVGVIRAGQRFRIAIWNVVSASTLDITCSLQTFEKATFASWNMGYDAGARADPGGWVNSGAWIYN